MPDPDTAAARPPFPWAWTLATLVPSVLAALVLRGMLGRALMPAQSGYLLMLMASCFLACFFALQLGWRLLLRSGPALWFLFVSMLPAAIGGWFAVRQAWQLVESREVSVIERELGPLMGALSSGSDWSRAIPSAAPRGLSVWRDERGYLVAVEAGSIDIDGSTLYFDSSLEGWRRFYDGSEGEEAKHFESRTASLPKVWPKPPTP